VAAAAIVVTVPTRVRAGADATSDLPGCSLPDAPLGSGRSAGCTTEVVREADADKARAGALGGPKHSTGTIRGAVRARLFPSQVTRCGSQHPFRGWRRPVGQVKAAREKAGGLRSEAARRLPPVASPSPLRGVKRRGVLARELSTLSAQNTPSGQAPTVRF
jgi:hypothetical protein